MAKRVKAVARKPKAKAVRARKAKAAAGKPKADVAMKPMTIRGSKRVCVVETLRNVRAKRMHGCFSTRGKAQARAAAVRAGTVRTKSKRARSRSKRAKSK